jgi:hypothetical protein
MRLNDEICFNDEDVWPKLLISLVSSMAQESDLRMKNRKDDCVGH